MQLLTITRRALVAATVCAVVLPATLAAQSTFTSVGAFIAAIGPYGIDTYDDLDLDVVPGPLARSAGAYSYGVRAGGAPLDGFFGLSNPSAPSDVWLSTEDAAASITFDAFGSNVFAIGGRFFATDFFGGVSGTRLFVNAVDVMGNSVSTELTPQSSDDFFGIRFDYAVASLTLTADNDTFTGEAFFATANDLVLGEVAQAVPEPTMLWLLAVGAAASFTVRRRERA
jgi:hypothetical protein